MEPDTLKQLEAHLAFVKAQLDYLEAMVRAMPTRSLLNMANALWVAGGAFVAFVFGWSTGWFWALGRPSGSSPAGPVHPEQGDAA